jgi:hypothetical protein
VKFTIEILRAKEGAAPHILHRVALDEMNPKMVRTKAANLLAAWRRRGANAARIFNGHGEALYSLEENGRTGSTGE